MKYPIEDIKTWGEIIIDDDKTFDELIEFYLPFRLSELDTEGILDSDKPKGKYQRYCDESDSEVALRLDPNGPSLSDIETKLIDDLLINEVEIQEWMEEIQPNLNIFRFDLVNEPLVCFYIALATYANNSNDDRVLAMDILYCLIGSVLYGGVNTMEVWDEKILKTGIAEQVSIQWGNRDVAGFILADVLAYSTSLFRLKEAVNPHFFGTLSDLVGLECYFDRVVELLNKDNYYVDDLEELVEIVQLSIHYLDNDIWARELYKKTLEVYDVADTESEYISEIAYSIAIDLKDKKWSEEVYEEILTYAHENTTPEGLREIEKSMDEALGGSK